MSSDTDRRSEIHLTLGTPGMAETVVERSRFVAYAHCTETRAEAQALVKDVAGRHPKASHVCWAYRTGWPDAPEEYWSDAGEPSGTAGRPILSAIQQREMRNLTAVVARYFGGVKLGVRGLIDAYRDAASAALDAGKPVQSQRMAEVSMRFPYVAYQTVRHHVVTLGGSIEQAEFGETVQCVARVPRGAEPAFSATMKGLGAQCGGK